MSSRQGAVRYRSAYLELGMSHAVRGCWTEAIAAYERYRDASGDNAEAIGFIAHAEAGRSKVTNVRST